MSITRPDAWHRSHPRACKCGAMGMPARYATRDNPRDQPKMPPASLSRSMRMTMARGIKRRSSHRKIAEGGQADLYSVSTKLRKRGELLASPKHDGGPQPDSVSSRSSTDRPATRGLHRSFN